MQKEVHETNTFETIQHRTPAGTNTYKVGAIEEEEENK